MKNKTWTKWTKEDDEKLKELWENATMEKLLHEFPNRNYNSLMCRASTLKIKSKNRRNRINGDLSILLEKNPISFYLLGFILADGCFTSKNDITVSQTIDNKDFFYDLIKFMNGDINKIKTRTIQVNAFTKKPYTSVFFRVGHKKIIDQLKYILKIESAKTYNPIGNIEYFFQKELLPYFFIGLVDGDGCVWLSKKSPQLRIEMHRSWFSILEKLCNNLNEFYNLNFKVKLSKRGYAQLWSGSVHTTVWAYNTAKSSFHMKKKWSKIDSYIQNIYNIKYKNPE